MTLAYLHKVPGTEEREIPDRLRGWDGSSPYHKNRQARGPRGRPNLSLIEKNITFRNVPEIKEVTIAAYVPVALKDPDHLLVARTALLAITGTLPQTTDTRANVAQWGIQKGRPAGVKTTIRGNAAYEFIDRCVHLVFPRIKEWNGLKGMGICLGRLRSLESLLIMHLGSTGDSSGNLSWGFSPEEVALFPEIEVNYNVSVTLLFSSRPMSPILTSNADVSIKGNDKNCFHISA
jgi:large subunit ribosomal protein L5